ncbi:MAG: DUF4097 family beta strand repeat protein [Treponema sp.]|nr:DUF4097 family beta strand repeat protein [Treponema sp.]
MTREEYLKELKGRLQSLTTDELAEALQYYSDYFEEAGDDEKVMSELGNPEELAKSIVEKCANAPAKKEEESKSEDNKSESEAENERTDALYHSFESSQVKNLSLEFGAADIVMISGNSFAVETRGMEETDLSCFLSSEGTLTIKNLKRINLNFFSHDRRKRAVPRILLTVPENADLYKFTLHLGAGNFRTRSVSLRCQNGNLEVGAGNLEMNELCGGKINLRCGMGNLQMSGTISGKSNIDCGMGSVKLNLRGSQDDYSYDAKVGLGDFRLNDIKKSGVCQELNNQKKPNHFSVNCGMGSVFINIK